MTNLTTLANDIFEANAAKGFWDRERPLTETTMLIVTELAEAVEEERAGRPAVWYRHLHGESFLPGDEDVVIMDGGTIHWRGDLDGAFNLNLPLKPEGVDIELIDALIRLLDLLGARGVDVDELLAQKLSFNATRAPKHDKAY